jgi:hypothetical protein
MRSVVRCAALTLVLLVAPAGARATVGRLSFSLLAGGGYSSDVFLRAGLGPDGLLQVTPSGRLDLSLAPRWKLTAVADTSYGHAPSSGFDSLAESASLEARWLGGEIWEVSLEAAGEHVSYSLDVPLEGGAAGPAVSSTTAGRLSSLLRLRSLGFEWRTAGLVAARSSTSESGDVPETELALLAGAVRPLGAKVSLAVTYKLAHTDSTRPDLALTSHAVFGLLSWRLWALGLQAQLQLQTASPDSGAREDLGRFTLSAALPIAASLDLEAVYSLASTRTNDPDIPAATRHLVFLGLRWRVLETTW